VTELSGQSLQECLFHFFSPEPHTRVHDYFPKTLLVTDVLGSVRIQQSQERAVGTEAKIGTSIQGVGEVEVGGSLERRHAYSLAYDRLPPLETLTAVGTLGRGSGVYFKQRQTSQNSLEGSREFILVLRVPQGWSAGYLRLVCQARTSRHADASDAHLAASQSFLLPLYAAGDLQAKQAALELQNAEMNLWNEVLAQQESIRRANRPTVAHELLLVDPVLPENWLSQIIRHAASAPPLSFERRLPPPVQAALEQYRSSKRSFDELAGATGASAPPTVQSNSSPLADSS
jgi:hypothetical protein